MGHQSYVIGFNTEDEKKQIINAIKEHNKMATSSDQWESVGEELYGVQEVAFEQPYQRGLLKGYNNAILCGNGGGRTFTYSFFDNKGFAVDGYTLTIDKRLSSDRLNINIEDGDENDE